MHRQFTATRDIKFPDSKQYMKFGDVLLFDDTQRTMTIYRNSSLIGTVPFSNSGLQEFLRLGWILDPSLQKVSAVLPSSPKTPKVKLPVDAAPRSSTKGTTPYVPGPVSFSEPTEELVIPPVVNEAYVEERIIETPESEPKSRKTKKS